MNAAATSVTTDLTVRRLLESGRTCANLLAAERAAHANLLAEREHIRRAISVELDRAGEVLAQGAQGIAAHSRRMNELDLRQRELVNLIEQGVAAIKLLESPKVRQAFTQRDSETTRRSDVMTRVIVDAERHLLQAAQALKGLNPSDALQRGAVQRFGDLVGLPWPDGLISPAVRHRAAESLAEIFAGARRPEPPRAA